MICISYVTLHRAGTSWTREYHIYDDVIKWKHFPRYWPIVRGIHRSPVNSPHKGQWRGALMFSLICVWINGWANNREAGDLRRYHTHYDGTVILCDMDSGKLPNGMIFLSVKRIWDLRSPDFVTKKSYRQEYMFWCLKIHIRQLYLSQQVCHRVLLDDIFYPSCACLICIMITIIFLQHCLLLNSNSTPCSHLKNDFSRAQSSKNI